MKIRLKFGAGGKTSAIKVGNARKIEKGEPISIDEIWHLQRSEKKEAIGYVNRKGEYIFQGFEDEVRYITPENVREVFRDAIRTWHTHPHKYGIPDYSAQDILFVYYTGLPMEIFCDEGILVIEPLRKLSPDIIRKIDEEAWEKAEHDYWIWKSILMEQLPVKAYWKEKREKGGKAIEEISKILRKAEEAVAKGEKAEELGRRAKRLLRGARDLPPELRDYYYKISGLSYVLGTVVEDARRLKSVAATLERLARRVGRHAAQDPKARELLETLWGLYELEKEEVTTAEGEAKWEQLEEKYKELRREVPWYIRDEIVDLVLYARKAENLIESIESRQEDVEKFEKLLSRLERRIKRR